jgi:hypothetical protein
VLAVSLFILTRSFGASRLDSYLKLESIARKRRYPENLHYDLLVTLKCREKEKQDRPE